MTHAQKVAFLRAKLQLLKESFPSHESGEGFAVFIDTGIKSIELDPKASQKRFDRLDRDMAMLLDLAPLPSSRRLEIDSQLRKRFGFSSFSVEPERVINAVLRRMAIKTEDEVDVVERVVANVESIKTLGEDRYRQLNELLAQYNQRPE